MLLFSKIYSNVLLILFLLFLLYSTIFIISSTYDINKTIDKFNYISNKHVSYISDQKICEMFTCSAIKTDFDLVYYDKNIPIYSINKHGNYIHLYEEYFIDIDIFNLALLIDNKYIYVDLVKSPERTITIMIATVPIIILLFGLIIIRTIYDEQKESIIRIAGNEAILTNKSMISITENIHHELNTPLEVIDNKLKKIQQIVHNYIKDEYENIEKSNNINVKKERWKNIDKLVDLDNDFKFIETSSEQIYNVLEKMKGFKNLRYSNGNKTVYDVILGSFKIIALSNTNFEYKVDHKLMDFNLDNDKIKNADVLNIMINHLKNSLEANSSKIYVGYISNTEKLLSFSLRDNGNGINEKTIKNIFNPNFSTKSHDTGIRGNGLYLNRSIVMDAGGDIKISKSNSNGTTFNIIVPYILREDIKKGYK